MKHQITHRRIVTGLVALTGLAMGLVMTSQFEPVANAGDDKVFAPQSCLPLDDDDQIEVDDAEYTAEEVTNVSSSKENFICPLTRDIIDGDLDRVWVRLRNDDEKNKSAPECCVYSVSVGAGSTDFDCEDANDDETQSLEFKLKSFTEYDNGHYAVICELDEDDSIISIRTSES